MSRIMVNGAFCIEGAFSFSSDYDPASNPPLMKIEGTLSSRAGYLPDIRRLENERYLLDGVYVYREGYGSEEDEIVYYFTAKSFAVANRLQEVKTVDVQG